MLGNPSGKIRVAVLGHFQHQLAHHATIGRQVVAAKNGEGRHVAGAPKRQPLDQQSDGPDRRLRVLKIVGDGRMRGVKSAADRMQPVGFL